MKNRPVLRPRQLFALCYAGAAVLWAVWCLVGCAVMLNYKLGGDMPSLTLTEDDLSFENFARYDSNEWWTAPDDRPEWYLSTSNDPRIYWQGQGYIERVELHADHLLPPGGVALYYLLPGQTDYSEAQKVFASVAEDGVYRFDLGGKRVTGLRIDPDSAGGVPTLFYGIELNPAEPWCLRFVPNGGQWLLLLLGPAVAAALLGLLPAPRRRTAGETP